MFETLKDMWQEGGIYRASLIFAVLSVIAALIAFSAFMYFQARLEEVNITLARMEASAEALQTQANISLTIVAEQQNESATLEAILATAAATTAAGGD